ncbi:MAG: hypothetical protein AAFZ65_20715, partial [Planctomycetota bacterium]
MNTEPERAWIQTTDPEEWSGELAELRGGATDPATGEVDSVLRVHSLAADSQLALDLRQPRGGAHGHAIDLEVRAQG